MLLVSEWAIYGQREQTRREHLLKLQAAFGLQTFGLPHYRAAVPWLAEVARQTDKGVVLVQALMGHLRRRSILLPAIAVLERLSAEALTRANRRFYQTLTEDLTPGRGRTIPGTENNGKPTWLSKTS